MYELDVVCRRKQKLKGEEIVADGESTLGFARYRFWDETAPQDRRDIRMRIKDLFENPDSCYLADAYLHGEGRFCWDAHKGVFIKNLTIMSVSRTLLTKFGRGLGFNLDLKHEGINAPEDLVDFGKLHEYIRTGETYEKSGEE